MSNLRADTGHPRKRIDRHLLLGGMVILFLALAAPAEPFWSFKPNNLHDDITRAALKTIFTDKQGAKTLISIINANIGQDGLFEKNTNKAHFDSETFEPGAKLIATRLNAAIDDLNAKNKSKAVFKIGTVLHALQDFYSHSNWVENHMGVNPMPAQIATFDGLVTKNNQGKFSASNTLKKNENFKKPTLVCDFDPQKLPKAFGDDLEKLSTGYFPDADVAGKCKHEQLNKDGPEPNFAGFNSPRGSSTVNTVKMSEFAKNPATRHTKKLIEDLLGAIAARFGQQDGAKLVKLLTHDSVDTCLGIDTSAAMAVELAGLQAAIDTTVGELIAADEVPLLHLVTFTDTVTEVGSVGGLDDLTAFSDLVAGLSAAGGADCPEASIAALERCLAVTSSGGAVITVTDASPSGGAAAIARVADLAREKDIALDFLVTGDCGDGGVEVYRQLAADSGGFFFRADGASSGSVELAAAELMDRADPKLVNVLLIEQEIGAGGVQSWGVPVDGELSRVDFVFQRLSGGSASIAVLDPSASPISVSDLGEVQVARVTNPAAGQWTMIVSGDPLQASEYSASVQGLSGLSLVSFSHLEVTSASDDEHPSSSIFRGAPLRTNSVDVVGRVTGTAQAAVFEFADFADCAVVPPPIVGCSSSGLGLSEDSDGLFTGSYVPTQPGPLLVRVRGTDEGGNPMQRVIRRPIRSSTLRVRPPAAPPIAVPGSPVSYTFEITNGGSADTFALEVLSPSGFPSSPGTSSVALAAGGTAEVQVTVTVPVGIPPGEDPLLLRATSIGDDEISNMGSTIVLVSAGNLEFAADEFSAGEADGTAIVTVTRSGGSAGTVSVDYTTQNGSAGSGADYTVASGTLTFAPGDLSETFEVPIAGDTIAESSERVKLELSNFTGGALPGDVLGATLTILDDDPCVSGWGAFPPGDTGVVPGNEDQSRCEQKIAKKTVVLVKKILKCHRSRVGALAKGKSFDADACDTAAVTKFLDKADTAECTCADPTAIAATAVSALDANNDLIYCDPGGAPIGGDETGTVPSTNGLRKCEDKIAKEAAKLVKFWMKCHISYARCKKPLDEERCEEEAIAAFADKVARLEGCDGCEDIPGLIDVIEAQVDGNNDLIFCQ